MSAARLSPPGLRRLMEARWVAPGVMCALRRVRWHAPGWHDGQGWLL